MSRSTLAGAAVLLAAPVVEIVAALVQPTFDEAAAQQVAAIADHRVAAIAALALTTLAAVLLIAGTIWLALAVARHVPRLALAGGILGVLGMLVVLFENGIEAAAPSVVGALGPAQATAALDRVQSSAGAGGIEPLTVAGCVGLALLAIGVVRAGAARWAAVAIAVGAFVETAGFATGTRAVVVIGFALLLAGLVPAVRALVAPPRHALAAEAVPA